MPVAVTLSAGVAYAATQTDQPIVLDCSMRGRASEVPEFGRAFCAEAARGIGKISGRRVVLSQGITGKKGTAAAWVGIQAAVRAPQAAAGSISWGSIRDGRVSVEGQSRRLDARANDASLNTQTAKLLVSTLIASVPDMVEYIVRH